MRRIVDVVNFNADASCLSSRHWLNLLGGGAESLLLKWLRLYAQRRKKVTIGFMGATVADIATHNPEAISFINSRPDIFEVILRPFAHDIALLRLREGFAANFAYGRQVISREFKQVTDWFLPPEFMITNEQLAHLVGLGVAGMFINPERFSTELRERIPVIPYRIKGLFGTECDCIPFGENLTAAYLHALQRFDASSWNRIINNTAETTLFSWRDGESPFFLPDGLEREAYWLEQESAGIVREHLNEFKTPFIPESSMEAHYYRSFPVHSFTAWMKEFRMLGFISRVIDAERKLASMPVDMTSLWLASINSDILSAVEKRSPVVEIADRPGETAMRKYVIRRSERGFEGEEYLAMLEESLLNGRIPDYLTVSDAPHIVKLRGRMDYLRQLVTP